MRDQTEQFTLLKGVDKTLAMDLIKAGIKNLTSLAEADPKVLAKILGIKDEQVLKIQAKAKTIAERERSRQEKQLNSLLEDTERIKEEIQILVDQIRDEASIKNARKTAKTMRKKISLIMAAMERMEDSLFSQMKRLSRGLAKADEKLARVIEGEGIKEAAAAAEKAYKKLDKSLE